MNGSDFIFSGLHSLNLTLTNVTPADAGNYSITPFNYVGNVTLWFRVDVIFPPRLVPLSKTPLVLPTGSEVTMDLAIFDAVPPVVFDHILWIPSGGVETFDGSHTTVTFRDVSPGNPSEVTVFVAHPARRIRFTFQVIVLDPPIAPVNFSVSRFEGNTCKAILMWQTTVPLDNFMSVTTDTVGLEMKRGISDQWEQLSSKTYPVNEPQVLNLEPETVFEFRAYNWSSSIGRGKETMGLKFNTTTVNPHLNVNSLQAKGINSSSISVTWSTPLHDASCYMILSYELFCKDCENDRVVINTTIKAVTGLDTTYSRIIGDLSPKRSFDCSISVTG